MLHHVLIGTYYVLDVAHVPVVLVPVVLVVFVLVLVPVVVDVVP